jgi:NADH-quinone oxidoreductase subunit N
MTTATLYLLLPEMLLIAVAVALYLAGAFSTGKKGTAPICAKRPPGRPGKWGLSPSSLWHWIAGGAIVAAAIALSCQHASAATDVSSSLYFEELARLTRWLALGLGILLLLASSARNSDATPEYVGSLLLTIAGLMLVSVAGDLVLLFVALELISIPTYVLLYVGQRDAASQEAAAKYFFLSVLASAILLYGFSFLYGIAGSTQLSAMHSAFSQTNPLPPGFATLAKLALALVFGGLCFRIAAVPFHFYAPDVFQGTTHPNAALLSVVPKAAGLLVMTRILVAAMPDVTPRAWQIVLCVSLLTMTFGNGMALWQDNLRRLLAYSSIANAGYMLLAVAVALAAAGGATAWDGIAAMAFYLGTYSVATIGAFASFQYLGRPDRSLDGVDELAGLGSTMPLPAAALAVCLFSLTGIPPLAGFWGKFLVLGGALSVDPAAGAADGLRWWFIAAAVVGVLNAAVAAAYYLRIVAVMYFRTPLATPRAEGGTGACCAAAVCALVLIAIGVYPGPLMRELETTGSAQAEAFFAKPRTVGSLSPIDKEKPPLQSAP